MCVTFIYFSSIINFCVIPWNYSFKKTSNRLIFVRIFTAWRNLEISQNTFSVENFHELWELISEILKLLILSTQKIAEVTSSLFKDIWSVMSQLNILCKFSSPRDETFKRHNFCGKVCALLKKTSFCADDKTIETNLFRCQQETLLHNLVAGFDGVNFEGNKVVTNLS